MPDFWRSSGYHLLESTPTGHLAVTDDYFRAYLRRPEMRPVADSCAAEVALHDRLLADPRSPVDEPEIAALEDPDARDNYRILLRFRERLAQHGTVEGAYLSIFLEGARDVPPLFIDQMAHVILRGILDRTEDPLQLRAAELLFREQSVTLQDGRVLLADKETVDMHAETGGFGDLGKLVVEAQTPVATVELDVLDEENGALYWTRDEGHDTVIEITFGKAALDALCRVLERWVRHFLDVAVRIGPVQQISDERWVWHTGLDIEASAILNDLYNGVEVGEARLARILSLFRLDFVDPSVMRSDIAGRPVYLAIAMNEGQVLHLKPQNLLVNLPLAERA